MRHRIFIAINFPQEIKKELSLYQEKWPELPIRWVKPNNLHLTLTFLGYLSEENLLKVIQVSKEIISHYNPFLISFKKIIYGPPKKVPPKMVWIEGKKCPELARLKKELEETLIKSGIPFRSENREFKPHITLGRINQWEFKRIEPEERPRINEETNLNFKVRSIEIMESKLKRGGAEYIILESIPLRNN